MIDHTAPGGLHLRQILRKLEKATPEDVMISNDIGDINSIANNYLHFNRPWSFLAAMSFGNYGYAFPAIIEVMCRQKLSNPFRHDALSKPVRYLDKCMGYV